MKSIFEENIIKRLGVSVLVGVLAAVLVVPRSIPGEMAVGWWGVLYPKYCYMQYQEDESGEIPPEVRVKIKFLFLK